MVTVQNNTKTSHLGCSSLGLEFLNENVVTAELILFFTVSLDAASIGWSGVGHILLPASRLTFAQLCTPFVGCALPLNSAQTPSISTGAAG